MFYVLRRPIKFKDEIEMSFLNVLTDSWEPIYKRLCPTYSVCDTVFCSVLNTHAPVKTNIKWHNNFEKMS